MLTTNGLGPRSVQFRQFPSLQQLLIISISFKVVTEDMYFDELRGEEIYIVKVRPTKREMNHCPICNKVLITLPN
jgi:hypothetical protein